MLLSNNSLVPDFICLEAKIIGLFVGILWKLYNSSLDPLPLIIQGGAAQPCYVLDTHYIRFQPIITL
jgi:hypothetical protein